VRIVLQDKRLEDGVDYTVRDLACIVVKHVHCKSGWRLCILFIVIVLLSCNYETCFNDLEYHLSHMLLGHKTTIFKATTL